MIHFLTLPGYPSKQLIHSAGGDKTTL